MLALAMRLAAGKGDAERVKSKSAYACPAMAASMELLADDRWRPI